MKVGIGLAWALLMVQLLTGCARFYFGDERYDYNPRELPRINISNFSPALRCMDDMLYELDVTPISVTAQAIPNYKGDRFDASAKEMLITAITKISHRSNKVQFVSYGTDLRDVLLLHQSHVRNDAFVTPDYFIRGGITQLDKGVMNTRTGASIDHPDWRATLSMGEDMSLTTLDLTVGQVADLKIIPGVYSNNVLATYGRGAGNAAGGSIDSLGATFDFGVDTYEGEGQALRNLVELGVIEIAGKLLDVPYMSCLPFEYQHPEVSQLIADEFQRFSNKPYQLTRVVQYKLSKLHYYNGPIDGMWNEETGLALNYFQALYKLEQTSGGQINHESYSKLVYGKPKQWGVRSTSRALAHRGT